LQLLEPVVLGRLKLVAFHGLLDQPDETRGQVTVEPSGRDPAAPC